MPKNDLSKKNNHIDYVEDYGEVSNNIRYHGTSGGLIFTKWRFKNHNNEILVTAPMYLDKELPNWYIYTLLNWFSVYGIFNSQNESSQVSWKRD